MTRSMEMIDLSHLSHYNHFLASAKSHGFLIVKTRYRGGLALKLERPWIQGQMGDSAQWWLHQNLSHPQGEACHHLLTILQNSASTLPNLHARNTYPLHQDILPWPFLLHETFVPPNPWSWPIILALHKCHMCQGQGTLDWCRSPLKVIVLSPNLIIGAPSLLQLYNKMDTLINHSLETKANIEAGSWIYFQLSRNDINSSQSTRWQKLKTHASSLHYHLSTF